MELKISKENALAAYNEGCSDVRKVLTNLFGAELFKPKDIISLITSYEDACKYKGLNPEEELPYKNPKNERQTALNGWAMADIIVSALNTDPESGKEWIPDYNNSNQAKWYCWMKWDGSGFGFSDSDYGCDDTGTTVGARLVFKTEALAIYFGKNFSKVMNMYLTKTQPTK